MINGLNTPVNKKCHNCCENHLKWLIEHLAPVIFGVKPSEILSYRKFDCDRCQKLCHIEQAFKNAKNIKLRRIHQDNDEIKIFFYNPKALKAHLEKPKAAICLKKFGYPIDEDIEIQIDDLVGRIEKGLCPHEIGVFLGYPIKDVLGYLGWSSLSHTKTRCWKIYGDSYESDKLYEQIICMRQRVRKVIMQDENNINKVLQNVV